MIRKVFKVIYEIIETGEVKSLNIIGKDRYEIQNSINQAFNKGILKQIKIHKIIESVRI